MPENFKHNLQKLPNTYQSEKTDTAHVPRQWSKNEYRKE